MDKTTNDRAPWLRRALLLFVGLTGTAIALSSCFSTDTVECSTGLICPAGYVCTEDGTGCTNTVCGNGVVDSGEQCDDGNLIDTDNCPSSLTNVTACQTFRCGDGFIDMEGSGPDETEDCDDEVATTTCDDNCTPASCGDGDVNPAAGEACDNGRGGPSMGASGDSDECDRDCSLPTCQDGVANMEHGEQCDNGPDVLDDNCSPTCLIQDCGNMIVDPGEMCDDGNTEDDDDCRNNCLSDNTCGNGVVDDNLPFNRMMPPPLGTCLTAETQDTNCAEVCDDGGNVSGDGCSANCLSEEICSNAITDELGDPTATPPNLPEFCDDGDNDNDNLCRNDCQGGAGCGNRLIDSGEQCDDGTGGMPLNTTLCDIDCSAVVCGDALHNPAREACDPGAIGTSTAACDADCTLVSCGDGFVNSNASPPEFCDNVGAVNSASCDSDCTPAFCGDGHVNAVLNEQCDNLNNTNSMTCDGNCTTSACGDGFLNTAANEQCDDGGVISGDGCTSTCVREPFTLAVFRTGSGAGAVASSPAGITCGADCTESYPANAMITLTATPTSLSYFAGWSGGGCTGTGTCVVTMDASKTVTAVFDDNTLSIAKAGTGTGVVTSLPAGIACGTDCSEDYDVGTMVTLTAVATAATSDFTGWSDPACPGTGACSVTMTAARTITATFTLRDFTLTVVRGGTGGGTVASAPAGIDCGTDCTQNYTSGTVVTLVAEPNALSNFTGWSAAGCGTATNCSVTMTAATTVTATFTLKQFTLTAAKTGSGTGTVTSGNLPQGINCGSDCSQLYDINTVVTLTATPDTTARFVGWTGGCSGTGPCVVTMDVSKTVTAEFRNVFILTATKIGSGTGTVTSAPAGIDCGLDCTETYDTGTSVTLTATPDATARFVGWTGACTGTGACTVSMTAARTVTAEFRTIFLLTVVKAGSGVGTVTSSPAGISCGIDCDQIYDTGTSVTLTASASPGSRFSGWSGAGCSGTGSCVVAMTAAQTVTATFITVHTLTVNKTGSGAGTVTSGDLPQGINCGSDCTQSYDVDTVVTLTATPDADARFVGWTGACSGTGACVVTMDSAKTVTAEFRDIFILTVSATGSGTGTVTSAPSGINCGVDCTETYDTGTSVTLTPTADVGSRFVAWTGACTGSGACTVSMTAARNVTAEFRDVFLLTVVKAGLGTGTVTSSPAGISCGTDCDQSYDAATVVTLTAAEAVGSRFNGWSGGGCSGIGTCVVTMNAAQTVTATFLTEFTLTVSVTGSGDGEVTASPAGITCGSGGNDCTQVYDGGTVVTLSVTPDNEDAFTGWSGACTGTGACVVTMSAARTVTATFDDNTLTVSRIGSGEGEVRSSAHVGTTAINCGGNCSEDYVQGTAVTLTADPTLPGARFVGWSGNCIVTVPATPNVCVVTMNGPVTVEAEFVDVFEVDVAITGSGSGAGSVTSTSSPTQATQINCGGTCTVAFDRDTVVTLTATAGAGARFAGWAGACTNTTGTCVVTMTAARSVSAIFTTVFPLHVDLAGLGTGKVTSSPAGIDCGNGIGDTFDCDQTYDTGASITLTATPTPATGSTFTGWSGDVPGSCNSPGPCTVSMSQARNVTATFAAAPVALTVVLAGSGTGSVTSDPAGILCGIDCTESYPITTLVTLTASAGGGSLFAGWSGGGCIGTGTCEVTMAVATSVTATFNTVAALSITTASPLDFGTVTQTESSTRTVTVTNTGGTISSTLSVGLTGSAAYSVVVITDTCSGAPLAASASCTFNILYAPTAVGTDLGTATVTAATGGSPSISLTGASVAALVPSQSSIAFGDVTVNMTATPVVITFTNEGAAVTDTLVTTPPPGVFPITNDTCHGNTVAPAATCSVTVSYAPLAAGPNSGNLTIDGTPGGPSVVALTGNGVP